MSDAESDGGSYQYMDFASACLELLEETIGADRVDPPGAHCQLIHEVIIPYLSSAAYAGPTLPQALLAMNLANADDGDGEDPPLPLHCEPTLLNEAAWYLLCSLQPHFRVDPATAGMEDCDWIGVYDAFQNLLHPYADSPSAHNESYMGPLVVGVSVEA